MKDDDFALLMEKLPLEYRKSANALSCAELASLEEIRIRAGGTIIFTGGFGEIDSGTEVSFKGMASIVEGILDYSVYAYMEELCKGFVTLEGGHRIGICGKTVMENGRIKTIKEISSINIRRGRAVQGCSEEIINLLIDSEGRFRNTLIISPPKCGKTTMLRDLILQLGKRGIRVSLVDERSEIAAVHKGLPRHDVGDRCDVMDGCGKAQGIILMIRSMAPDVVCTDEIGSMEDVMAIREAVSSGIGVLTSVHGMEPEQLRNSNIGQLIDRKIFERYVIMTANPRVGSVSAVLDKEGKRLDL